jgi:hypothetical protein
MAISRSLMNRQLRASGGIMDVTPRENFGLGSSLKKFVRKIIPNEISEIAVKAAPFVAPFNPALAGVMSGVGTFDQTGSISAGLKSGAMNYGGGQLARYAGGAGFQGNPFGQGGAFTGGLQGFTGGFSSPIGTETGLGKFFSNQGTVGKEAIQGIGTGTTGDASMAEQIAAQGRAVNADSTGLFAEGLTGGNSTIADAATQTITGSPNQMTITDSIKQIVSPNSTMGDRGTAALDLLKRTGKAAFTKPVPGSPGKTQIDKAAIIGTIAFAGSYAEAKALAEDAGVELTEEAYDESRKAEKQEEYAGYLTNFFGGKKDGGRIGFKNGYSPGIVSAALEEYNSVYGTNSSGEEILVKDLYSGGFEEFLDIYTGDAYEKKADGGRIGYEGGANELIKDKLMEDIMPDTSTEEMIMIMTETGPKMVKKSDFEAMSGMFRDTTTSLYGDAARGRPVPEFANGGRINRRFGSPEEGERSGVMEMLSVDVDAGGDDEEDMLMAYTPGFSSQEKSYLFRRMGASGGAERSYTMPQLYRILKNPADYPEDAAVLKEIAVMGLGKKDGGRIGLKDGTGGNRVSQLLILRDEALSKGEDTSIFDAEIFQLTGKTFRSIGGISEIPTGQPRLNQGGVAERDYRETGGFVPVGIKERADDVPAMLSKNEFVMTADAVRGIGNGSVEEGSKKLYNTMKQAEQKGKIA